VAAERLQKVLSRAGIASRRAAEILIADGKVTVNGAVAILGDRADPETDLVEVDGAPVTVNLDLVHYLLNKPVGTVSTVDDPQGRPTVVELVPADPPVYPVGRLDRDTEGLILLTNNGELTHRLTHPSFGVDKEYLAHVEGEPSPAALRRLREGIELDDGSTAPARASSPQPGLIRITIHEGRNRQVRRMCEAIGHPVIRLVRTRIGPVADRSLKPGQSRPLTDGELRALEVACSTPAGQRRPPTDPAA